MKRACVVTGGSSGIGAATSNHLLDSGYDVYNLDIVANTDSPCQHIYCDLGDPASIVDAIEQLPTQVDSLVCAAGVAPGSACPPDKIMAVNFLGMRALATTLLPRVRNTGSVVIVASSAGRDWRENKPEVDGLLNTTDFLTGEAWLRNRQGWQNEAYRFSKQCAAAWTHRATGIERNRQVRVNCVNPGIVETRLSGQFRDMLGTERYDWIVEKSGRAGKPEDIARVITFLAIGESEWLNGVELTVDGGYYSGLVGGWIDERGAP